MNAVRYAAEALMLPEVINVAWLKYAALEACGERAAKLTALRVVVRLLEEEEQTVRAEWARDFLARKFDKHDDLPVRAPLFRAVLFPFLEKEYANGDAAAARWLAELAQDLFRCRTCWKALGHPSELDLWREAFRRNPNAETVRRNVVLTMVRSIRYTLHEVPSGVLFGIDGATPEQCKLLQAELSEFRNLLRDEEVEQYRTLIETAEFHYRAYGEYLSGENPEGYAQFLKSR